MALDSLYKLPETNKSAMGVAMSTIALLLGITALACWAATQYAAHKLGYQTALGAPLMRLGSFALYAPWDFFVWLVRFGHVAGTEKIWTVGEVILGSLHFLFIPAVWNASRRAKKMAGKSNIHGSAHWATRKDVENTGLIPRTPTFWEKVKRLIGIAPPPKRNAGVYVGGWVDPKTKESFYLQHDGPEHVMAFAPTRSGKGVGLVLPTLLSWRHSAVVHDIKGEAWALTSGFRKALGHKVLKFEPSEADGSSIRFNPLIEVRIGTMKEVADAQNIAAMIVDPDGKGMDDHWAKTGHELLSAAIIHILYLSKLENRPLMGTLRGLVSFFCDPQRSIDQVADSMLNTIHDPEGKQGWVDPITGTPTRTHPVVAESARSFMNKSENERSGVQSTAMSFLSLYRDPIVAMNTAVSEFRIRDLMNSDKPVSLYLVVPPNDKARLRPLIRLMINLILGRLTEKMDFADGRSVAGYKHRLLMMLDEFPALGKIELIEESMAFVAGYGIKYFLITQDLTQLTKAYSRDESIISNCHVRIAYAPNKIETAELVSKYLGTATVEKENRSYSGSRLSPFLMHQMASVQEQQRALLTPDECLRLPGPIKSADGSKILEPGDMIVMVAGSAPIYGKQILYFRDKIFDKRSKIKPPAQSDRLIDVGVKAAPVAQVASTAPVLSAEELIKQSQQAISAALQELSIETEEAPAAPVVAEKVEAAKPVEPAAQAPTPAAAPAPEPAPVAESAPVSEDPEEAEVAGEYTDEEIEQMNREEEEAREAARAAIDAEVASEAIEKRKTEESKAGSQAPSSKPSALDFDFEA